MCNAIATSKPIIYFNIGLRNLTLNCENYLRSRCIWIDVDTTLTFNLYELLQEQLPAHRENSFSKNFSIGLKENSFLPRKSFISNIVKSMI